MEGGADSFSNLTTTCARACVCVCVRVRARERDGHKVVGAAEIEGVTDTFLAIWQGNRLTLMHKRRYVSMRLQV